MIECRQLQGPSDEAAIERFIMRSPRYETLLIRPVFQDRDHRRDWWFGSHDSDEDTVNAVMCVKDHTATMYSDSVAATQDMAMNMRVLQQLVGRVKGARRHELLGPKDIMATFWKTFRVLDWQVRADFERALMGSADQGANPSKRVTVTVATAEDFKMVVGLLGERAVEAEGFDPRRMNKEGHARYCRALLERGGLLIGRDGLKPVFICSAAALDEDAVLLDSLWVPLPFRRRKRLIGGALWAAAHAVGPGVGKEVLFFADTPAMVDAGELAGFTKRAAYRLIVMLS